MLVHDSPPAEAVFFMFFRRKEPNVFFWAAKEAKPLRWLQNAGSFDDQLLFGNCGTRFAQTSSLHQEQLASSDPVLADTPGPTRRLPRGSVMSEFRRRLSIFTAAYQAVEARLDVLAFFDIKIKRRAWSQEQCRILLFK